jgi:hypothetical protein
MAPHLDWDEDQKAGAVDDFLALQERRFGVPPEQNHPSSNQTSTGV